MPEARPEFLQGEVWRVEFYEGGVRPAVVVSRNELNRGRLILVVPCTSSRVEDRRVFPNHVFLPAGAGGLTNDSVAETHLIQPVEVDFALDRLGVLPSESIDEILLGIAWTTGLFETVG